MRIASGILLATSCLLAQNGYQPIASSKQIMTGVQKPAMDSLSEMAKAGGPKDEAEWAKAAQNAALIGETAQLLLLGSRPLDQDLWIKSSERLRLASAESAKAAEARDLAAWKTSLGAIGKECRACHNVHRKKPGA